MSDKDLANWLTLDEAMTYFGCQANETSKQVVKALDSLRLLCWLLDEAKVVRTRAVVDISGLHFSPAPDVHIQLDYGVFHSRYVMRGYELIHADFRKIFAANIRMAWTSLFQLVLSPTLEAYLKPKGEQE